MGDSILHVILTILSNKNKSKVYLLKDILEAAPYIKVNRYQNR